jgi:hypothetical protein
MLPLGAREEFATFVDDVVPTINAIELGAVLRARKLLASSSPGTRHLVPPK